ncbi:MAG: PAS domain S-box protein [Halobacteriota archaeon]
MKNGHPFVGVKDVNKIRVLLFTVLACVILTFYVSFFVKQAIVYSHFFYIPILLAGVWYHRKAVYVALFLGSLHILATYFFLGHSFILTTFERMIFFVAVAYVVGVISEKEAKVRDAYQVLVVKRRAEEELRKKEEKYRSLVESTDDSIYLVDKDCRYLFLNEKHLSRLGLSSGQFLGRAYGDFHSAGDAKRFDDKINRTFETGTSVQHEYRDSERRCFLKTLSPVKDPGTGKVTAVTVVSKDITGLKRTEKELRETRDYLDNIIASSADTITVVDMKGIVRDWNKSAEGIMGYRADEVIGTSNRNFFAEPEEADRIMERVQREGEIRNYRTIVLRKDGKPVHISMSAALLRDKNGVSIGTVRVSRDITKEVELEERIKEERDNLNLIFESMTDGVYVFSEGYEVEFMNKVSRDNFGDQVGGICYKRFHGREEPCPLCKHSEVMKGKTVRWEWYSRKTNKSYDLIETPLRNIDGTISKLTIFRDITERKRVEDALRTSEKQLREIFESMADGVYLVSEDYEVEFMNRILRDEFGDQRGRICHKVFHGREEPCPRCKHLEVMKGKTIRWEWYSRRMNKTYDLIETPLRNIDGTISKLTIFRDVTDRKKAEAMIQKLNEELELKVVDLEEVTRMKTEFLSLTSHELRTPLTPMKSQLEMLQEGYKGKMSEKQKDSIEVILRNLTRLNNLIEDILDISRIEAGRIRIYFESMSINDAVKEAIKMQEPFAEEEDIKIRARFAELPTIIGDAERLRQVISNLLNNAIKFSEKPADVVVETRRVGGDVLFSVTDNGIGISKEDKEKLFKPFSQIDTSMGREHGGSGLGLAIAKGIIQAHNGKIWVKSEPGKGTTFYFSIPINQKIVEKDAPYIV